MYNPLIPVFSRIAKAAFPRLGIYYDNAEIISPAISRPTHPALHLSDDVDRIISYENDTSKEQEQMRIKGLITEHGETKIYNIKNAHIFDGVIYSGNVYEVITQDRRKDLLIRGKPLEIDEALLCTTNVIDRYFGHWLMDGLVLEELASRLSITPLTISNKRWLHEPGYRSLTSLEDARHPHVKVNNLKVADDRGLNALWIDRAVAIKHRIRSALSESMTKSPPVFMLRGNSGTSRKLVNENEISDILQKNGFITLNPEEETSQNVARAIANTTMVVTVEGSAQEHVLLSAPPGAWIITIMPPRRMNSIVKTRADALGLEWAFTVAEDRRTEGFYQPVDRLMRIIDQAFSSSIRSEISI